MSGLSSTGLPHLVLKNNIDSERHVTHEFILKYRQRRVGAKLTNY